MTEKLYRRDHDLDHAHDPIGPIGIPGKVPVTARLPARPVARRAEATGPRDDNGVAAGADEHVARAAGASGSPLPDDLRGRFEASLGADLSGVRIHTGAESQTAARAVGAKAYTTGQDIHFAEDNYDPSSAFGVHLIAHEVAHTVQQAGGPPVRQHKLEVSTPGDAAEVEADRAADAMVAGIPASVSLVAGALHREAEDEPLPTTSDKIDTSTEAAEREAREAQAKAEYKPGAVLSNRYSQQEARGRLKKAQAQTSDLEFHAAGGNVEWDKVNTNHATIAELSSYADMRDSEASDLGTIVTGQKALQQDFARLNAAVSTVQQECGISNSDVSKLGTPDNPIDHTKPLNADGQTGQKLGEAIGDRATLGDKTTGKTAALAELRLLTNNAISDYHASVADVNASATGVKDAGSKLKAATASLTLFNLKQENADLTSQLQAAQADAACVADIVSAATGLIVACAGVTGGLSSAVGGGALLELKPSIDPALKALDTKVGDGALATVNDLITRILVHTSGIGSKIARISGALQANELATIRAQKDREGALVAAAAAALDAAIQLHKKHVAAAEAKQQTMRTALSNYGARLDEQAAKDGSGSGDRFKIVGKVMGECDAFIGQANLVWATIKSYKSSAASAKDQRRSINEAVKGGDGARYGMPLWSVEYAAGSRLVNCENIQLHMSGSEAGGADDTVRPQDAVARIEGEVRQAGSIAFGMRNQLAVFMGLNVAGVTPEFMG